MQMIRQINKFAAHTSGGVAIIFALAAVPLVGAMGAAVDYGRASTSRSKMQSAADGAALAAVKEPDLTDAQRIDLAKKIYAANIRNTDVSNSSVTVIISQNQVVVKAFSTQTNKVMPILGKDTTDLAVTATAIKGATSSAGNIEIALVLDTTGSMANDMSAMRSAAKEFVESTMTGTNVKVSVVPYVASVNIGPNTLSNWMIEKEGKAKWHGVFYREAWAGSIANCDVNQSGGGGGGGGPGIGSGGYEGGNGQHLDIFKTLNKVALELFGVKNANADMMNTIQPITGKEYTAIKSSNPSAKAFLPAGMGVFTDWQPCRILNPPYISHWDLFKRIPNARWKGCVEARPEPFDVTDDAPTSANIDSLFVQYFYPDESDSWNNRNGKNNYLADTPLPPNFTGWGDQHGVNGLFKYNGVTNATINEVAPDTKGPNRACPDELLPLRSTKSEVLAKIDSLKHYNGGGTISSEGIAWGWRTLSPNEPFRGTPYSASTRKVIVLMTDGVNEMSLNSGKYADWDEMISEYTAYGFLRDTYTSLRVPNWPTDGRFPQKNFQSATTYLNGRMSAVCENAKKKGIEVYTILFKVNNTNTKQLVEACATKKEYAFSAADTSALTKAFKDAASKIAGDATGVRIVK
jgi:Flp pilus assembly protein TadG